MRRVLNVEGLQAFITADAVLDMDNQVAWRQGRGLGQEVGRPTALAWPRQAVAQDVGLGDDRQLVGLESGLQRQHHALRRLRVSRLGRLPVGRQRDLRQAVIGQHAAEPL